jgi:hypothetical protein
VVSLKAWTNTLAVLLIALCTNPATLNAQSPSDTSLLRARTEYRGGHFVAAEERYIAVLPTLARTDNGARAAVLAELADVYVNKDELWKAERL